MCARGSRWGGALPEAPACARPADVWRRPRPGQAWPLGDRAWTWGAERSRALRFAERRPVSSGPRAGVLGLTALPLPRRRPGPLSPPFRVRSPGGGTSCGGISVCPADGRLPPDQPGVSTARRPRGLASSESGRLCRVAGRALLGAHAETPARMPGSLLPHVLSLCSGVWRGGSCGHDDPHPHLVPTMASPEARRVPDRLGLGARAGRGQGAARHSGTWDVAGLLSSSRPLCGRTEPQDSPAEAPGRPRLECTLPNPWLLKNCLSSLLLSR